MNKRKEQIDIEETKRKERIKHKRGPRKRGQNQNPKSEVRKQKRKGIGKKVAIAAGSIAGVAAVVYLGGAFYFNSHFYLGTTVNGNDFSGKSVKAAETYMGKQVDSYVLTLN